MTANIVPTLLGKQWPWMVLTFIAVSSAVALFPLMEELPVYLHQARYLVDHGTLNGSPFVMAQDKATYPVGYSLLISPAMALRGELGIQVWQALVAGLTAWLFIHGALATRNKVSFSFAIIIFFVCIHPYILLNISRINESAFSVGLVLLLAGWVIHSERFDSWVWGCVFGVALGLLMSMRANALIFLALPMLSALAGGARKRWLAALITVSVSLGIYAALMFIATGDPFYFPNIGPYNFFAGYNRHTMEQLLLKQNAEPALLTYLETRGQPYPSSAEFSSMAWEFIRENPLRAAALPFVKTLVLFSPRWLHADNALELLIQCVLSLPILIYSVVAFRTIRHGGGRYVAWQVLFICLYIAPFVLTNADPRMRLPLDIALLAFTLSLWQRYDQGVVRTVTA